MSELLLTIWVAGIIGSLVAELRDVWIWHEPFHAVIHAVLWPIVLLAIIFAVIRDFIRLRTKP